jgi:prolyl-tRNA editing enzyme YbaK/EbsC (Cys-tRNA(Pro) deacylase)
MSDDYLARPAVRRVADILAGMNAASSVIVLADTARTAQDAANSLNCQLGAIVKSLVFRIGDQAVMALVAGDKRCDVKALPSALGLAGKARRADADMVQAATGFTIGGVAPLGFLAPLPLVIDQSLGRFDAIYAAAGHPHCVFATTLEELTRLTGGAVDAAITE